MNQARQPTIALAWAGAVLAIAFLLPNHYPPWLTFHQQLAAVVAFLPIVAWSAFFTTGHTPLIAKAAMVLASIPLAQVLTGQLEFHGDGVLAALYLVGLGLTSVAGARVAFAHGDGRRMRAIDGLWVAFAIASIVSVGISIHQWLDLQRLTVFIVEMQPSGRPFGNLAQPNLLASLLLLGLAGLWSLYETRRIGKTAMFLGAAWLVFGLVLTGSRFPMVCLLWAVLARVALGRAGPWRTPAWWTGVPALAFIAGSLLIPAVSDLLLISPATTALERASAPGIRTVLWPMMWDATTRSPWLGYGVGQIGMAQTAVALDYPPTNWFFDSAHNLALDMALWFGWPVALALLAAVLIWFVGQLHRCTTPAQTVAFFAIGCLLIHALIEYPLQYTFFLLPFGYISGALWAASHPHPSEARSPARVKWAGRSLHFGAAAAAFAATIWVTKEYLPLENDWRRLRFEEAGLPDRAANPTPRPILLDQVQAMLVFARAKPEPGMAPERVRWMRRISERYAYSSFMFRYALVQGLNNDREGAGTTLQRLCKMHPARVCNEALREWRDQTARKHRVLQEVDLPPPR